MGDFFAAIGMIAEQRIQEAQERGELTNLPGEGCPEPEDELRHVAPELRMAYRILKNANCLPAEVRERQEIQHTVDLLEHCPDERERLQAMRRLRLMLDKMGTSRHAALEAKDEYYQKVLGLLEKHERKAKASKTG